MLHHPHTHRCEDPVVVEDARHEEGAEEVLGRHDDVILGEGLTDQVHLPAHMQPQVQPTISGRHLVDRLDHLDPGFQGFVLDAYDHVT